MIKKIAKFFGIFFLTIILFSICIAVVVNIYFKDRIINFAIEQANSSIDAKMNVSKIDITFLHSFPNIAVVFEDVVMHPSTEYILKYPKSLNDTLIYAKKIQIEFNILQILQSDYQIKNIAILRGKINLFTDKNNITNYHIIRSSNTTSNNSLSIHLKNIITSDIELKIIDKSIEYQVSTYLQKLTIKGSFIKDNLELSSNINLQYFILKYRKNTYTFNKSSYIHTNMTFNNKNLNFFDSKIDIENTSILFSLLFHQLSVPYIDLSLQLKNNTIENYISIIPIEIKKIIQKTDLQGNIDGNFRMKGFISEKKSPTIKSGFHITNGQLKIKEWNVMFNDIYSSIQFETSSIQNFDYSKTTIEKLQMKIKNSDINISGNIHGIDKPKIDINISSNINLNDIIDIKKIDTLEIAEGIMQSQFHINGTLNNTKQLKLDDFKDFELNGKIEMKNSKLKLRGDHFTLEQLNGNFQFNNNLEFMNLMFEIHKNKYLINGNIVNIKDVIFNNNPIINLNADINSPELDLSLYFGKDTLKSKDARNLLFPENIKANVSLHVDKFKILTFNALNVNSNISYQPKIFVLNTLSFESMKGKLEGNGALIQDLNQNFIVQSQFDLKNIDIHQLFKSMNNFSQNTLKDENLRGTLNGKIAMRSTWTKYFELEPTKLIANADFTISNGELINFEPLKNMSKFLKLTDVQNIKFATLKNTIFIKDQQIIIPNMDISSTALNLSVSGTHGFNNSYNYNVKLLLSELLWGKAKKAKKESEEFGEIEKDTRTGTNIYLIISGINDICKVTYDTKRTIGLTKKSLKDEKDELKTIFNEEFGWKNNDCTLTKPKSITKPKVVWDEEDKKPETIEKVKEPTKSKPTKEKLKVEWE